MDRILELLSRHGDHMKSSLAQPRVGTVTSVDPTTARAKVQIQPENVLTGWLPVLSQWTGAGWGISCPPSLGDQVLIIPREGHMEAGIIIGRFFSDIARPPPAEAGEVIIAHSSGVSLSLKNSGVIVVNGDVHVSGDIYDAAGPLSRLREKFNAHEHAITNDQTTSIPTIQDNTP